jgi:hypothetical protein
MTEKNIFLFQRIHGHIYVQTVELLHWTPIIFARLRVWAQSRTGVVSKDQSRRHTVITG